jgi:hypothetical protein
MLFSAAVIHFDGDICDDLEAAHHRVDQTTAVG